jgi:tetratricopeptide (TPR) repeat protein
MDLRALRHWLGPFEHPVDRERLRSRVLAFAGLWFLLAGFLAALGFAAVLAFSILLVGLVGVVGGALWLRRRHEDLGLQDHLKGFTGAASHRGRAILAGGRRSSVTAVRRLRTRTSEIRRTRAKRVAQRRALRLNELGAQLRRQGDHAQAAEQHRGALAIVRELGDRRAEALTLNNLALALVHTGSVSVAVEHFEQALVVFRELGDEEHEGQVIANVGVVRRRQGRDDDAKSLLREALEKLPPESSAYHKVEEQLVRAS